MENADEKKRVIRLVGSDVVEVALAHQPYGDEDYEFQVVRSETEPDALTCQTEILFAARSEGDAEAERNVWAYAARAGGPERYERAGGFVGPDKGQFDDVKGVYFLPEDCRAMAHSYLRNLATQRAMGAGVSVSHQEFEDGIGKVGHPIESVWDEGGAIARAKGFGNVIPGSWIVGIHVDSDEVWDQVKRGEIKGFSARFRFRLEDSETHRAEPEKDVEEIARGIVASHAGAAKAGAWSGATARKNTKPDQSRAYYARIFGWLDPDTGAKSKHKFPHHFVDGDGNPGAPSINACRAGISVLAGGRGGTTIPEADKRGVHRHLRRHLVEAGLEVGEFGRSEDPGLCGKIVAAVRSVFGGAGKDHNKEAALKGGIDMEREELDAIVRGAITEALAETTEQMADLSAKVEELRAKRPEDEKPTEDKPENKTDAEKQEDTDAKRADEPTVAEQMAAMREDVTSLTKAVSRIARSPGLGGNDENAGAQEEEPATPGDFFAGVVLHRTAKDEDDSIRRKIA